MKIYPNPKNLFKWIRNKMNNLSKGKSKFRSLQHFIVKMRDHVEIYFVTSWSSVVCGVENFMGKCSFYPRIQNPGRQGDLSVTIATTGYCAGCLAPETQRMEDSLFTRVTEIASRAENQFGVRGCILWRKKNIRNFI